jgi:hypothetical protein
MTASHSAERGRSPCYGEGSEELLSNYGDAGKSKDSSGELRRHMYELLPIREPCTVANLMRMATTPFATPFGAFAHTFSTSSHTEAKVLSRLGSASAAHFQSPTLPGLSQPPKLNAWWNCSRAPRQSAFHLESEIRHATNTVEIRHFTTLLNSGDTGRCLLALGMLP